MLRFRTLVSVFLLSILLPLTSAGDGITPIEIPDDPPGGGGGPAPIDKLCGTREPQPGSGAAAQNMLQGESLMLTGGVIRVAFHVVHDGGAGNLTDAQIQSQMNVLNNAYAGAYGGVNTGYSFTLASIDRTDSEGLDGTYFGWPTEVSLKRQLAKDPRHYLNVYVCDPFVSLTAGYLLGWAFFPWDYTADDYMNGVVIRYNTIPGGTLPDGTPMSGYTLVHEVGHYLGLLHTFSHGCTPPGDEVDDTPYEADPSRGCPTGRNSCPDPGFDPIHNFMDYTDDPCMNQFTAGQDARMDQMVSAYRQGLFEPVSLVATTGTDWMATSGIPGLVNPESFVIPIDDPPGGGGGSPPPPPPVYDAFWRTFAAPPSARYGHAVATDGERMIVFGGADVTTELGPYLNDVWVLSLGTAGALRAPRWRQATILGGGPEGRIHSTLVWDAPRQRFLLFAGRNKSQFRNDVWALAADATSTVEAPVYQWTAVTPAPGPLPDPRYKHAAIFDPTRSRMVIQGGNAGPGSDRGDVWTLSLTGTPQWTQTTLSGQFPPDRQGHTAVLDAPRDRMVIYGGTSFGSETVSAYALALGTGVWTWLGPSTPPPSRVEHAAIVDPATQRMIVFGGRTYTGGFRDDAWSYDLANPTPTWTQLPAGTGPSARGALSGVLDQARNNLLVFGGVSATTAYLDEAWALPLAPSGTWRLFSKKNAVTPPARTGHTAIYDAARQRMVVFGGFRVNGTTGTFLNDVWTFDLYGTGWWEPLTTSGTPPLARAWHVAVYDAGTATRVRTTPRMLVACGEGVNTLQGSIYELSLGSTPTWRIATSGGPIGFQYPAIDYDSRRDRWAFFGGGTSCMGITTTCLYQNDVWYWQFSGANPDPFWNFYGERIPPERMACAMTYDPMRDRYFMFGGINDRNPEGIPRRLNDTWEFRPYPSDDDWHLVTPAANEPTGREGFGWKWREEGGLMVIDGCADAHPQGAQPQEVLEYTFNEGTPTWLTVRDQNPPAGRRDFAPVWDSAYRRMVMFGGSTAVGPTNETLELEGWRYLPGANVVATTHPDQVVAEVPTADLAAEVHPAVLRAIAAPNPFRDQVRLAVPVVESQQVRLEVFDVQGRLVRSPVGTRPSRAHVGSS
jgi:hypothetical protein